MLQTDGLYYFRTNAAAPGIFDSLFSGLFEIKGVPLAGQLAVLTLLPLAVLCAIRCHRTGSAAARRGAEAIAIAVFTLLTFFCLQPWDEVFINLRHSQNLAELGRFSFNATTLSEGTVDFLPYFLIGLLHRAGLPLVELAFVMSWAGGVCCLLALRTLFTRWGLHAQRSALLLAFSVFGTLVFNASNGFANTVFTAAILYAVADLFFDGRRWRGWLLLSVLPLIRLEGAWFSLLLTLAYAFEFRPRRRWLAPLLAVPTLALSYYRWRVFGSAVPAPIVYKAGLGNFFLTVIGARNALADLIATGTATALFALILAGGSGRARWSTRQRTVLIALALACAPYYSSGGDWFPSYWGRYLLPFSLFAIALAAARLCRAEKGERGLLWSSTAAIFLLHLLWPISSTYKLGEMFFAHRRTLARIHQPTIARGHYRVQHLSALGYHFGRTTAPDDVIASSEIATIMFFAHRDALDLLGVTNLEVARAPLREFPSLLRRFPERSELPYLIFKRLQPALLARYRPAFLYTFDFMMRDLIEGLPPDEMTEADLFRAWGRWEKKLGGLIDELYGGLTAIRQLGYRPVIVSYGNDFLSLYFVSEAARERHLNALRAAGFTGGWVSAK